MDELQEMREQMAALKEKLNKQEIITEQNLRHVISKQLHTWRNIALLALLGYLALVLFEYYFANDGRLFRPIAWAVYGTIMIIYAIQSMLLLNKKDIMSGNLRDVLYKLRQMRKREKGILTYLSATVVPIIFFSDGLIKICQTGKAFGKYHLLYIAIGLAFVMLGVLANKFIIQKLPSQWDEYIRQLEEITKDTGNEEAKEEKQ